jgi:curved DNA-binding protein CbpA
MAEESKTHYQVLGVRSKASPDEIRAAHRARVKELHPDRHGADQASPEFLAVQNAFEVLSDPARRTAYDAQVAYEQRMAAQREAAEASRARAEMARSGGAVWDAPAAQEARREGPDLDAQLRELDLLLKNKRWSDAEKLAAEIIKTSPRSPEAHGVLGDMARRREDYTAATKHYGFAAQYAPNTEKYIELYQEMADLAEKPRAQVSAPVGGDAGVPSTGGSNEAAPFMLVMSVWILCLLTVGLMNDQGLGEVFPVISEFSFGRILSALVAGITLGLWFNLGGAGGSFRAAARDGVGGPSGLLIGSVIGLILFWPVIAFWLLYCAIKRVWDRAQIKFGVGVIVLALAFGAVGFMRSPSLGTQLMLFAGGPILFAATITWAVTEPLRARRGGRTAR